MNQKSELMHYLRPGISGYVIGAIFAALAVFIGIAVGIGATIMLLLMCLVIAGPTAAKHYELAKDLSTAQRDGSLDALYQDTDICLFPYREIYGSGALLMAYSYGKPVIASDIPVFREETENGKAGLLFASEQPEQLKNAILQTLEWSGQTYQTCQQEIQTLVQEKYNWERSAKQLAEAYQKAWARKNK